MPEFKRNHHVPRFMLNAWSSQGAKYRGTWVYDIREGKKHFSAADGGSAFSFAIDNDLYVPRFEGERATAMERWFGKLEDSLSRLVRQAHDGSEEIKAKTQAEWIAATMGLFGLEHRSRYNVEKLKAAIEADAELRAFVAADAERSSHHLVLENIIHNVTEMAGLFNPIELIFEHTGKFRLICGDRPFFNNEGLDHRFVVLTNTCLAAYRRSPTARPQYVHADATPDFVAQLNQQIALNARDWIVAETEKQLDEYIEIVRSDAWKKRTESDKIEKVPLKTLQSGWTIPPDSKTKI